MAKRPKRRGNWRSTWKCWHNHIPTAEEWYIEALKRGRKNCEVKNILSSELWKKAGRCGSDTGTVQALMKATDNIFSHDEMPLVAYYVTDALAHDPSSRIRAKTTTLGDDIVPMVLERLKKYSYVPESMRKLTKKS